MAQAVGPTASNTAASSRGLCCCRLNVDTDKAIAIWKAKGIEAYTFRAPDGSFIPVLRPTVKLTARTSWGGTYTEYDDNDRIYTKDDGTPSLYSCFDSVSVRALSDFDYSQFGLVKVHSVWFNLLNRRGIDSFKKLHPTSCVIL